MLTFLTYIVGREIVKVTVLENKIREELLMSQVVLKLVKTSFKILRITLIYLLYRLLYVIDKAGIV